MTLEIDRAPDASRSFRSALWIGIGIMAAVDEIVFHQILAWHHFYDRSTLPVALLTDGLLHSAELILLVAGAFGLADLLRRHALAASWGWAGFLVGAGGFQLFDGIVDHKLLRVHQVRYGVELLPYDVAWNAFGVALLVAGAWVVRRARAERSLPAG